MNKRIRKLLCSLIGVIVTIVILPITVKAEETSTCHPQPDLTRPQYIIGYGSLMNEQDKRRTSENVGYNLPVYVTGFQREWNVRGPDIGFNLKGTFLGVEAKENGTFNAAIYRVFDNSDILKTDKREVVYCRVAVRPDQLRMADEAEVPDGQIWIYVNKPQFNLASDAQHPIIQNYVDTFLAGCIDLGEQFGLETFARDCIRTTEDWSIHWINDRIYPRRPIMTPHASTIDRLLSEEVPREFEAITLP